MARVILYTALFVCQILFSSARFMLEDCVKNVEGPNACKGYFLVYKYDSAKRQCVQAVYGGCNPTENNFKTKAECQRVALPLCRVNQQIEARIFRAEDCAKDVEDGPRRCKAYIPVFKWDQQKQQCVQAIYGGCNATPNNFKTKIDCEKSATPVCQPRVEEIVFNEEDCEKDVEEGPVHCNAYFRVYKWDQAKQQCVHAVYGGCHATHNNFETKEKCEKYARPVCQKRTTEEVFNEEDCEKDVEAGPIHCDAYFLVYKWDQTQQKCVDAIYGGCNPSHNNFKTKEACEKNARPVCQRHFEQEIFTEEDCEKDIEVGPIHCKASIPVYKWDQNRQECVDAIYGGCYPSHNNFDTKEECEEYAKPVCQRRQVEIGIIFEKEDCQKEVEEGPVHCNGYFPVYKWDDDQQQCIEAIYGGCHATRNNFKTKVDCEKFAKPICQRQIYNEDEIIFNEDDCEKDIEEGPVHCNAYFRVYKWDQAKQQCVQAVYGGCHATHNNFETKEKCEKYARPVCQKRTTEEVFNEEDCEKDVEAGPIHCDAYFLVYKWDQAQQKCVDAIYGGCNPSHNNFKTKEACEKNARPVCQRRFGLKIFTEEDCQKDVEVGPIHCMASIPVYKWDQNRQQCVDAIYGGCFPSHNNFDTKEDCEEYAKPVCQRQLEIGIIFEKDDCQKEVEEGPVHCNGYFPVYKWDDDQQQCIEAIYGGCHATHNNFKTKVDCEKFAKPICQRQLSNEDEVIFNEDDCQKDVEEGPNHCKAYFRVYKWDQTKQQCVEAVYGGCHKTHNNFKTKELCEQNARPVCQRRLVKETEEIFTEEDCQKEVEEGPIHCNAYIPVYKWDHDKQECVKTHYGGCHATHNNFRNKDDCEEHARPVCQSAITEEAFAEEDCLQGVEGTPSCFGYFPVYTWDQTKQACVTAIYGGCNPTANNFKTKENCEDTAAPVCRH